MDLLFFPASLQDYHEKRVVGEYEEHYGKFDAELPTLRYRDPNLLASLKSLGDWLLYKENVRAYPPPNFV